MRVGSSQVAEKHTWQENAPRQPRNNGTTGGLANRLEVFLTKARVEMLNVIKPRVSPKAGFLPEALGSETRFLLSFVSFFFLFLFFFFFNIERD